MSSSVCDNICQKAAAWIVKYRLQDTKLQLHREAVVVDPANRDGVFASITDIQNLGASILPPIGFTHSHTNGICVQLPVEQQQRTAIMEYNKEKTSAEDGYPQVHCCGVQTD